MKKFLLFLPLLILGAAIGYAQSPIVSVDGTTICSSKTNVLSLCKPQLGLDANNNFTLNGVIVPTVTFQSVVTTSLQTTGTKQADGVAIFAQGTLLSSAVPLGSTTTSSPPSTSSTITRPLSLPAGTNIESGAAVLGRDASVAAKLIFSVPAGTVVGKLSVMPLVGAYPGDQWRFDAFMLTATTGFVRVTNSAWQVVNFPATNVIVAVN